MLPSTKGLASFGKYSSSSAHLFCLFFVVVYLFRGGGGGGGVLQQLLFKNVCSHWWQLPTMDEKVIVSPIMQQFVDILIKNIININLRELPFMKVQFINLINIMLP